MWKCSPSPSPSPSPPKQNILHLTLTSKSTISSLVVKAYHALVT